MRKECIFFSKCRGCPPKTRTSFSSLPRRGQVTIFIILAILIVGGVIVYFALRKPVSVEIPQNFRPVYDYYLSCLDEQARQGISLLGEQGGYIEVPEFVPGSQYMPFSSQLDFFGQPVPYWLYVSGNNIMKEQVPAKSGMEEELENYVEERVNYCDFSEYELQGFDVFVDDEDVDVKVDIKDNEVGVDIRNDLVIRFGDQSVVVNDHELKVDSKLGKFYDLALEVYNYEKQNMFLEKYALDVMRLYAPVDGVDISCAPKIFNENEIKQDLIAGLSANVGALKLKGSYYDLSDKENNYFVTDIGERVDEDVNFIFAPNWPSRIEIYGDKVVEPVGLQEGLGILGFCYVPYHFVYDMNFPVLIQFYDFSGEVFQFPIGVVIDKNQERTAFYGTESQSIESDVCKYRNERVKIYTYDLDFNPVEAKVNFKCLNTECYIGHSEIILNEAALDADMPACVNGFVIASAEGYADAKYQLSTNEETFANVIMNKLYELPIEFKSNVDKALVRFEGSSYSATALYPDMNSIQLVEDYYNVSVFVYKNSTLNFPGVTERKCAKVPMEGVGGFFGLEQEKCFDINIPAQEIQFAVVGGGRTAEYLTEGMLKDANKLIIEPTMFETPSSLEKVQENFAMLDSSIVYVELG